MPRIGFGRTFLCFLIAGVFVTAAGCASTGSGGGSNRAVITAEEIQASQASNVFQLIQSVRGSWLTSRGPMTLQAGGADNPEIVVYVDGTRFGGVNELRGLATPGITLIQRMSASEATQRFGIGHSLGAILVSTAP